MIDNICTLIFVVNIFTILITQEDKVHNWSPFGYIFVFCGETNLKPGE